MDMEDKILNGILHFNKLKQAFLRTTKGPVSTLSDLKQVINLWIRVSEKKLIYMKDCMNDVL